MGGRPDMVPDGEREDSRPSCRVLDVTLRSSLPVSRPPSRPPLPVRVHEGSRHLITFVPLPA
jgi:hypothetical protein